MYYSIRPGKLWRDTNGKPIQAHGFSVFYNEHEKQWYWYGENKEITCVPGKLTVHNENTCNSRYVWLPIEWQGEKPVIRWRKEWRIEDI